MSCPFLDHFQPVRNYASQHENGDLRKIKGGLNLLKAGHPTLRHQLKVLKGG